MDYLEHAEIVRHPSWGAFQAARGTSRLLLLTTKAAAPYVDVQFVSDDVLILGRESAGVPQEVHDAVQARLRIPMREGIRSLNVAQAGAIVVAEALRQIGGFP